MSDATSIDSAAWPGRAANPLLPPRVVLDRNRGGALLRPGPLGLQRTPPPAQGGITTARAEASRGRAQ